MNKRAENRKNNGSYWIYGKHACHKALANNQREILQAMLSPNNQKDFAAKLNGIKTSTAQTTDFTRLLGDVVHQGIALELRPLPGQNLEDIAPKSRRIAILDSITDPHNIGAILRSANAFFIDAIVVQDKGFSRSQGVLEKVACGAAESVPIVTVTNISDALALLKKHGFWIAGLAGEGKNTLPELQNFDKIGVVLGAEGSGLRQKVAKNCDLLVKIDMNSDQESLNVSNAAAICFHEIHKKL